jgi:3-oxoacyl-[acyl-carrier protein] reductase
MSEKKHALVTGGSRGIGRTIIETLLAEGFEVWYLSRSKAEGLEANHISCDMANRGSVEAALETVVSEAKYIDVLVNNAGITRDGLIMRMKDEAWDDVIAVNLTSVFLTCRRIGRLMATQQRWPDQLCGKQGWYHWFLQEPCQRTRWEKCTGQCSRPRLHWDCHDRGSF